MLCSCQAPKIGEDVASRVQLIVPERVRAGEEFSLRLKEHELVFRCPENLPNDRKMEFDLSKVRQYKYSVHVPPGSSPCDTFTTTILGSTMSLICPVNRVQVITVTIAPSTFPVRRQELIFDINIPGGIAAFRECMKPCVAKIDHLEVPIVCPLRANSGNILRIVLPLLLPQLPENTTTAMAGITQDPNPPRITFPDAEGWVRGLASDKLLKWCIIHSKLIKLMKM